MQRKQVRNEKREKHTTNCITWLKNIYIFISVYCAIYNDDLRRINLNNKKMISENTLSVELQTSAITVF